MRLIERLHTEVYGKRLLDDLRVILRLPAAGAITRPHGEILIELDGHGSTVEGHTENR